MRNATSNLPGWRVFLALVMTPASASSTTPSENISEWMPRSFLCLRKRSTASGMAPMPNWRVAPSGTREAQCSPMAFSMSPILGGLSSMMGASCSTMQSRSLTDTRL